MKCLVDELTRAPLQPTGCILAGSSRHRGTIIVLSGLSQCQKENGIEDLEESSLKM